MYYSSYAICVYRVHVSEAMRGLWKSMTEKDELHTLSFLASF